MNLSLANRPAATVVHDSRFMKLVYGVLRPLVRLTLRMGMTTYELCETVRWLAVDIALNDPEFAVKGRNVHAQTKSHAAVFTGLPRREVMRLCALPKPDLEHYAANYHRAARVLAGWLEDPEFHDENGKPRELPVRSVQEASFARLCQRCARDVPPRALLDQLIASGNVVKVRKNTVRMVNSTFSADIANRDDLEFLAQTASDFLGTAEDYLRDTPDLLPRFREIYYHHIPKARIGEFRDHVNQRIQEFSETMNEDLRKFNDPALPPKDTQTAGIGLFSFYRKPE